MRNLRIAIRYAKALFILSKEFELTEIIKKDMAMILETVNSTSEFQSFLISPVIKEQKKIAAIKEVFKDKIHSTTFGFLKLVIGKRRFNYIDTIAAEYLNLYRANKGLKLAEIQTAMPLEEDNKVAILQYLKDYSKHDIELAEVLRKELIGGFILKIDDIQYDASIKSKLNKLRKQYSVNIYEKGL